jgi:Flp pilus assembly protein CpaB
MKNRIPIIAAVLLGIFVIFAIQNYLKREKAKVQDQLREEYVLGAAQEIEKGTEITEEMLTWLQVPGQAVHHQAMTTDRERSRIIGRKTRIAIPARQAILWTDLEIEKRGGLSSLIPEGERAFSVEFGESDLFQLNDRVDIIGIFNEPSSGSTSDEAADLSIGPIDGPYGINLGDQTKTVCIVLLQNVNIIALGTTIGESFQLPGETEGGKVTFSLTLPEAQLLQFASTHGELAMVLRRDGDISVIARKDLERVTMQDLERITGELDEERTRRIIRIMKGRNIEKVTVETNDGVETFGD